MVYVCTSSCPPSFLLSSKITILYKSLAILIAFIRPLPRVYSHVAYKLTILQDHITTLRALIWSFTVCALTCPKRLQLVAKLLSHWWHLYAFFSVCILLWFMKPYSVRKSFHTRCIDKIYLFYGLVFGSHVMQFIIHHITIFKIAAIIKTISALFLWSIIINLWSPLLYTF